MSGRSGLVAVLFTDLVGSTELMSRLGDRAFDELRRKHFTALSRAVAAHGGEEVKNTGDGLMAVFSSAADAIEAAVAMQQGTARQAGTGPLAIRVGVAVGDATLEAGDYFGTPVVEAARLVAAAGPGQILTTQIARALAGSRCTGVFTDQVPLELKGLPEPVAVCEVRWPPLAYSPIPLPTLLTDVGRIFVGRDADLQGLDQLWKEAAEGELRVVLLAGEPGVGKTRLAAELAARVHEQGASVLAGRCDEDLGVPYQPFVEALRQFLDRMPRGELSSRLGRFGGELGRLVPELSERVAGLSSPLRSDPETERYRLFDAVAAWLATTSAKEPVLLVLDDLQWAAKPTLLLLRHVVRTPSVRRVLVLGAYRDTELSHDHPLVEVLADLRRQEGVARFSLTGLDSAGVAAFVEDAAGHALEEDDLLLARAIHDETEGNPFFVREVLRHLAETGAIMQHEQRWSTQLPAGEVGIPEGVREVVGKRLSRLSAQTNRVLRTAAVVAVEFEAAVVQAASDFDEEELTLALEEAMAARLLLEAPGGRYRFSHALVQETVYQGLFAARRTTLHRRVAEAIEVVHGRQLDAHLPALAHHWARAAAPAADTARAVEYATRAGDRALSQLANDEAVAYYAQALDLLDAAGAAPEAGQRVELLVAAGEAQRRAGDPRFRETLLEAAHLAQRVGDASALARAAVANNRGLFSMVGKVDGDRVRILETALDAVGPASSEWRARLLANLAIELTYSRQNDRRRHLVDEAFRIARQLGDPATLGHVVTMCLFAVAPTTPTELQRLVTELHAAAARLEDPALGFWAAFWRFLASLMTANLDQYDLNLDASDHIATELGQPFLQWMVMTSRSAQSRIAGRLEEADAIGHDALEFGQASGIPDSFRFYGGNLFWVCYDQGRLDTLVSALERAVARDGAKTLTGASYAIALCELDRASEARLVLEDLVANDFASIPFNMAWLFGMTMIAEACAALKDVERSSTLYERLLPYHDFVAINGNVGATGAVAHYLGLLTAATGRSDEADLHFRAAEATHHRLHAPTWLARTRLEWARMLRTRRGPGDAERARELLGQALGAAREVGLGGVERQVVVLLGELS